MPNSINSFFRISFALQRLKPASPIIFAPEQENINANPIKTESHLEDQKGPTKSKYERENHQQTKDTIADQKPNCK